MPSMVDVWGRVWQWRITRYSESFSSNQTVVGTGSHAHTTWVLANMTGTRTLWSTTCTYTDCVISGQSNNSGAKGGMKIVTPIRVKVALLVCCLHTGVQPSTKLQNRWLVKCEGNNSPKYDGRVWQEQLKYGVVLVSKIKFDMHHKLICNSIGILC